MTTKATLFLLVILFLTTPLLVSELIRADQSAPPQDSAEPVAKHGENDKNAPTSLPPPVTKTISRPGLTVRENYFFQLPGISLSSLTPGQKKRYLERVNVELCNYGCPNDTVARCLVNDRTCTTVKGLAQVVLSEVKAGL